MTQSTKLLFAALACCLMVVILATAAPRTVLMELFDSET